MDTTVVTSENLAEFNAKKLDIAPKEASKVEEVAKEEPKEEVKAEEAEQPEEKQEETPKEEPKKPHPINERFSKLSQQRKDAIAAKDVAEARAKALEERVNALETGKPKPADPNAKPNPDDFKDAFAYAEALSKWSATEAIKAERTRTEKERADKEQETIRGQWVKNVESIRKTHTDYDEVVSDSTVQVSDQIRDAILESDNGPLLVYHLCKNPDEAEKLSDFSPRKALLELGKLEQKLTAKPERKDEVALSKAPPPINPIRGSSTTSGVLNANGEFTGTFAEYKAARMAGKIK